MRALLDISVVRKAISNIMCAVRALESWRPGSRTGYPLLICKPLQRCVEGAALIYLHGVVNDIADGIVVVADAGSDVLQGKHRRMLDAAVLKGVPEQERMGKILINGIK